MIKNRVEEIKRKGFTLIPNVISENECKNYKELLEKHFQKHHKYYVKSLTNKSVADKSFEKVVYNLHNKDLSWFKLFENNLVIKILNSLLKEGSYKNKEPFYLNNISARCPYKGNKGQPIHLDSNLPGVNYNIVTNVIWYFDDVNKKNGTTIIVPKSHKFMKYPNNNKKIKNLKYISAKKGSVLIFNANLWHGGSSKNDFNSRWALILGYARWFIKPSFDYMKNTPKNIYKRLNDRQKSLLGFSLVPPKDEFTRMSRRSEINEIPEEYKLNVKN